MMDLGEDHLNYDRLKNIEQYVKIGSDLTRQLLGFAEGGKLPASEKEAVPEEVPPAPSILGGSGTVLLADGEATADSF